MSHLPISFKRGPRARACDTCRRWKKRCDQLKPGCSRCIESNSECTYSYVEVYYRYESETALRRNEASRAQIQSHMPIHPQRFHTNLSSGIGLRRLQSNSDGYLSTRSNQTLPPINALLNDLNPPRRAQSQVPLDLSRGAYSDSCYSGSYKGIASRSRFSNLSPDTQPSPLSLPPTAPPHYNYHFRPEHDNINDGMGDFKNQPAFPRSLSFSSPLILPPPRGHDQNLPSLKPSPITSRPFYHSDSYSQSPNFSPDQNSDTMIPRDSSVHHPIE